MGEPSGLSTAELLTAWRDATRAAELAEQLALLALEASQRADHDSAAAVEIADLAARAAEAAERTAEKARTAAARADEFAAQARDHGVPDAQATLDSARGAEAQARNRYHDAEREAWERHQRDDSG